MQVEVSVQDCFYKSSLLEASDLEASHQYTDQIAVETWETWFKRWLENLHPNIPPARGYELSLRLTDDQEIQALNSQYRKQNKPTDVLAFAALEVECPQPLEMRCPEGAFSMKSLPLYLGDIVISVNTALRQAQQQGHTLKTELAWLAAHGLLHLLGWDHPDEDSLTQMLNQQHILLQVVSIAVNTSENRMNG